MTTLTTIKAIVADVTCNLVWLQVQPGARVMQLVMPLADADRFRPFVGKTVQWTFEAEEDANG